MAKPETVDRIQIIAEAPSLEAVGAGLVALTKLGFENVGFRLVTDILQYKHNEVRAKRAPRRVARLPSVKQPPGSNRELLEQIIESRKDVFTSAEIMKVFRESGRNPNSSSPLLYKMTQQGLIEHVGKGQYQRTTKSMNGWALGAANG